MSAAVVAVATAVTSSACMATQGAVAGYMSLVLCDIHGSKPFEEFGVEASSHAA
jgi:hypothetical protein